MGKDLNRRTFLKGMAAGAVVAMGTGLPQVANGKDINSFAIFIAIFSSIFPIELSSERTSEA